MGKELKGLDDSAKHESEEVRERVARLVGGGGDSQSGKRRRWRVVVEDNAVNPIDDVVDLRDEGVEAAQNDAALTQGLNIADPVEDQEEDRVGKSSMPWRGKEGLSMGSAVKNLEIMIRFVYLVVVVVVDLASRSGFRFLFLGCIFVIWHS